MQSILLCSDKIYNALAFRHYHILMSLNYDIESIHVSTVDRATRRIIQHCYSLFDIYYNNVYYLERSFPVNIKHLYNILYNVGTMSSTLVQHCINVIQLFCVYWVVINHSPELDYTASFLRW